MNDMLECQIHGCHTSSRWLRKLTYIRPQSVGMGALEEIIIWPDPVERVRRGGDRYWKYQPYLTASSSGSVLAVLVVLALVRNIPTLKRLIVGDVGTSRLAQRADKIMDRLSHGLQSPVVQECSSAWAFSWGYKEWVRGVTRLSDKWVLKNGDRNVLLVFISPCSGHQ